MKINLTTRHLEGMKPPAKGRTEISDEKRPGLRFRLSAKGRATWVYERRIKGGQKRKVSLGQWPAVSLAEARSQALAIEAEASQGVDRVAEAKAQTERERAEAASQVNVSKALDAYETLHVRPNLKSAGHRMVQLNSALRDLLDVPVKDLSRENLQSIIDAKARTAPINANRYRAQIRAFVGWLWRRGYIENDVGAGLEKAIKEKPRDRVLSLQEVRAIFEAADQLGELYGPIIRLLVLTGQRKSDIAELRWSEVETDAKRIVLSSARTKNGKPHIVHLSAPALAEIERSKAWNESQFSNSEFVFTTTGEGPVNGFSKTKSRLDALLAEQEHDLTHWVFHDLRTALATELAERGEPETVVDRILNHAASGSAPSSVARVYNRAEQLPARAAALDRWARLVTTAEADTNNVLELGR